MEVKNTQQTGTFQDYIKMAEVLIGKDDASSYLEGNKELFEHPQFYKEWCKVYFLGPEIKKVAEKFPKNSLWATFHPDWVSNFGKIVVRKNTEDILITSDEKLVLQILNTQIRRIEKLEQSLMNSLINVNKILDLKMDLTELYNAKEIKLYNNKIEKIPDLHFMKNLKILRMPGNEIEEIGTLPDSLEELWLSNNKLKEIPKNLPNSLKYLDLANNKITEISKNLPNSIEQLCLGNNEIKELIENLPNSLEILDLCDNKINKIITTLPISLKKLYLYDNPIYEKYNNSVVKM